MTSRGAFHPDPGTSISRFPTSSNICLLEVRQPGIRRLVRGSCELRRGVSCLVAEVSFPPNVPGVASAEPLDGRGRLGGTGKPKRKDAIGACSCRAASVKGFGKRNKILSTDEKMPITKAAAHNLVVPD
ncbi:hypothetical protein J6590_002659 [Homalodisca vitripennis]|nr:hypothetical protein J6590_002659 [Homalodisca vitripennis]